LSETVEDGPCNRNIAGHAAASTLRNDAMVPGVRCEFQDVTNG